MIDAPDFKEKQLLVYVPENGDKMSYFNDNITIKDKDGKIKFQTTCYRLFTVFVIGNVSITSGLIQRAGKFRYSICMMTTNLRTYQIIGGKMEGNTVLRKKQYAYDGLELAAHIVRNKILNQRTLLNRIRKKTPAVKEAISKLDNCIDEITYSVPDKLQSLLGVEGSASRVYFSLIFSVCRWNGRKPRVKNDYVNSLLDIGYTMLFNFIDALLRLYGFDVYYGVLHRCFYMRKSLVCDIMEPFRPIIDWKVRTAINLGQCKEDDFEQINHRWVLKYQQIPKYTACCMEAILEYKMNIFYYVQSYYRCFMKGRAYSEYPVFNIGEKE